MKEVEAGDWTNRPAVSGFISRGLCGLLKEFESIMFPSIMDISVLRLTVRTWTDSCKTGDTELVILRPGAQGELLTDLSRKMFSITINLQILKLDLSSID